MDVQVPIPILDKDGLQAGMHFKDLHHEESIDTLDRMAKDY
jgi:hypothetical protein